MDTLVINLFGGPGTGKSTLSATLFAHLKMAGIDVEFAPEYVKDLVWEESFKKIENQVYIFGKQHNRLYRLQNKVKVIITDSPLLNSIVYYTGNNPFFKDMVMWEYKQMNNLSFFLERSFEYNPNGRMQTLDGAKLVDETYQKLLTDYNVEYTSIKSPYNMDYIFELIERQLVREIKLDNLLS
jgi:nicotinamide riboside kinase